MSEENQQNTQNTSRNGSFQETINIKGDELVAKVKELIKEGNVRRIIIKNKEGQVIAEFPLTIGLVGALFAPVLAAIGAIAALLTEGSITIERRVDNTSNHSQQGNQGSNSPVQNSDRTPTVEL